MTIIRRDSHTELSQKDRNRLKERHKVEVAQVEDVKVGTQARITREYIVIPLVAALPIGEQARMCYLSTTDALYLADSTGTWRIIPNTSQGFSWTVGQNWTLPSGGTVIAAKITGDSVQRIFIDSTGRIAWGNGTTSSAVVSLQQVSPGVLKVSDGFGVGKLLAEQGLEQTLTLSLAGAVPASVANDVADFLAFVPFDMTLRRMKLSVKTAAATLSFNTQLRRSTDSGATFADVSGFVATLAGATKVITADPSDVNVDEGDVLNISIPVGALTGAANLLVQVIGTPR